MCGIERVFTFGDFTGDSGCCIPDACRDVVSDGVVDDVRVRVQLHKTRAAFEIREIDFLSNLQGCYFLFKSFECTNIVAS